MSAHRDNYTPEPDKRSQWVMHLVDLVLLVLTFGFIFWTLAVLGPSLDHQNLESKNLLDAEAQAQRTFLHDVEAAKECRRLHGETLIRYTADGELVCVPRHSKQAIASNP